MSAYPRIASLVFSAVLLSATPLFAEDLLIGEIHPITGPASFYGKPMTEAIQLAIEEINAGGGVKAGGKAYTLVLVSGDDQANATTGVAALRKVINEGAKYIIGPLASGVAPALKPIFDANPGVTQFIDGTIADGLLNGRNVFRNQTTPDGFSNPTLALAAAKKYQKVAIITDRLQVGYMGREGDFVSKLEGNGAKVVAKEYMKLGDTDFSAQLTNIVASQADALMIRAYPNESALITKQAHQLGFRGQLIWCALAPPDTVVKNISDSEMEGVYNGFPPLIPELVASGREQAKRMAEAYRKKYGKEAGELSALSYDAVYTLKAGIEKAGTIDNDKVNAAMFTLKIADIPTLVNVYGVQKDGRLFDDQGQALLPGTIHVWKNKTWAPVDPKTN